MKLKKIFSTALVFVMLFSVCSSMGVTVLAATQEFYVSASGDDSSAGTLAAPFKTLAKAISSVTGEATISLLSDCELTNTLSTLTSGQNITFELNGYTIKETKTSKSSDLTKGVFTVPYGATLTLKNGYIKHYINYKWEDVYTRTGEKVIYSKGGNITLDGVDILMQSRTDVVFNDSLHILSIYNDTATGNGSTVKVIDSKLKTNNPNSTDLATATGATTAYLGQNTTAEIIDSSITGICKYCNVRALQTSQANIKLVGNCSFIADGPVDDTHKSIYNVYISNTNLDITGVTVKEKALGSFKTSISGRKVDNVTVWGVNKIKGEMKYFDSSVSNIGKNTYLIENASDFPVSGTGVYLLPNRDATTIAEGYTYVVREPDYFNVTLNTNGGTCDALTKYDYGVDTALPTPTKDYCTFDGWYTTSTFTGEAVTGITATDFGDKEFFAKWNVSDTYVEAVVSENQQKYPSTQGAVDDGFGKLRFIWQFKICGTPTISNYGAYIVPFDLFENENAERSLIKYKDFTKQPTDGQTFSADITSIPSECFDKRIYAIPFINNTLGTATLKAAVNDFIEE